MFEISKSFDFCYGHRVFSQQCNVKYALDDSNPCRKIHGHQGKVQIHMRADALDSRGFVIDFKELTFVKKFIDDHLDHRFIISTMDPNFKKLVGHSVQELQDIDRLTQVYLLGDESFMGYTITDPKDADDLSFFIVEFNPTSEELAKWIFNGVNSLIEDAPFKCITDRVVWSETPKTQAVYSLPVGAKL